MSEDWQDDLAQEKSLWDAFKVTRKFPQRPFNTYLRKLGYPFTVVVSLIVGVNSADNDVLRSAISVSSQNLLTFSVTVIGFLVAGLSIFTSLADKKVLIELAKTKHKGTEVSVFKVIYFNLISVFVVFLTILFGSFFVGTAVPLKIRADNIDCVGIIFPSAKILNSIILSFLIVLFLEGLIRLKSFIWNIYSTFTSMLAVSSILDRQSPMEP